jgi:hypothetical protein
MSPSSRSAANLQAARAGIPLQQAGIDKFWSSVVARLNAGIPSRMPIAAAHHAAPVGRTSPEVDWTAIAGSLNKAAGFAPPARAR